MTLRLYFDDDCSERALIRGLRERGIDLLTSLEAGTFGASDQVHLEFASRQQRVLCTSNIGDFVRLHTVFLSTGQEHSGIVLIAQQSFSVGERMRRLLRLAEELPPERMRNWTEYLSDWG